MNITFDNVADEVTYVLTHGPTPDMTGWEVIESGITDKNTAWTVIEINGRRFTVTVEAEVDQGSYNIEHGIPGRVQ